MSQDDPKDIDAGGTIQLDPSDGVERVQLVDPTPAPSVSRPPGARKTPPPLPPSASLPPAPVPSIPQAPLPETAAPKPAVTGRTIALFFVLLAVCAAVGIGVGTWARSRRAPAGAPVASATGASVEPAAAPSAAQPSGGVLVLPAVEMKSP